MRIERVLSLGLAFSLAAVVVRADSVAVRVAAANVRSAPSVSASVVASVRRGQVLEVVEARGAWRHVRTHDGIDGWIAERLVEPVAQPAPPPPQENRLVAPAAHPAPSSGVAIEHKAVGCIVAEEYPRFEACFAPSEALGRAQVQFRAAETSPWYAVDMKADGPCYSAWLPKPRKETTSIDYFVFAIDKQFAETQRPEKAPGDPYQPRVVRKRSDCDQLAALAAWSAKTAPRILVNLVRDAGGKILDTAAAAGQAAGAPAGIAGFSSDGVVLGNTTTTSASTSSAGTTGAAAGGHFPVLAVAGGAVAAGGLVALVAKGGSDASTPGGGSSGGSSPSSQSLSGAWSGSTAAGTGLSDHIVVTGGECVGAYDVSANLVQSGNTLSGPLTTTLRSLTCNPSEIRQLVDQLISSFIGQGDSGAFRATLSPPGGISIPIGATTLVGTYTSRSISATGEVATAEYTAEYTLKLTKN